MSSIGSRYTFGGDEHLFVECSEEMSLEAFFKSLSVTRAIENLHIDGITEICPASSAFQIRFDPDRIHPYELRDRVKEIEADLASSTSKKLETRIIEMPVFYKDPYTHESLMRARERHQDPDSTDLEYAARINGYDSVDALVDAHSGSPWFVSMIGFVAGLPWMYQMVARDKQIQAPKYLRPRTHTPKLTIGHGGCFTAIYSVEGAGGYQMFGITPVPIYDPSKSTSYMGDFYVFFRPGDIVKFKPVGQDQYNQILEQVDAGTFSPVMKSVEFDFIEFQKDMATYNKKLIGVINDS